VVERTAKIFYMLYQGWRLEEKELVLWEDEVLEFIPCCRATAVDGSISPFNGIIINTANTMADLMMIDVARPALHKR